MDNIFVYLALGLTSNYLVTAYFESSFILHFLNIFTKKKLYTFEDYENLLMDKLPFFFTSLLTCRICISLHVSYLVLIGYILCGGKVNNDNIVLAIGVSAFIASMTFNKPINTQPQQEKLQDPDYNTEEDKEVIPNHTKAITTKPTNEIRDMGGYMVEFSESGAKLLGTTTVYEKYAKSFFEKDTACNFKNCETLKLSYFEELDKMEDSFKEKGVKCPDCNKSGLKRKYYDIIKAQTETSERPRQIPRSEEKTKL